MDQIMSSMPEIDAYQFGKMTIDGRMVTTDLIILPSGKVLDNWIRKKGHFLELSDLKPLIAAEPDTIVIGTGAFGRMQVDSDMLSSLAGLSIKVIKHANTEAIDLYNQLTGTHQKLGACFHLTC